MKHIALIAIILLAAFLRLYQIKNIPPGVNRDEASIGYTAYSLATTGKDEYGISYPLSFQSFGDWKLPFYIYLTIPFVKLFGLSELAVRLPSVLAGIGSVIAVYFLAKTLFASKIIGLFASFALAIMPWHLHISRVESEANVASFFVLVGLLLFFHAVQKKLLLPLVYSGIFFSLTYYTYHGNHVFTSLLLIILALLYWKQIINIKHWWFSLVVGFSAISFILWHTLLGADRTKIAGISIFGDPTVIHYQLEKPRLTHDVPDALLSKVTHNKITYALVTVYKNYINSFGPQFLFIRGGTNNAHNIGGIGNLHYIEAPLLLISFYWLLRNRKNKAAQLLLCWLAISAVSGAITKDAPHTNRMFAGTPAFALVAAIGVYAVRKYVSFVLLGYALCMMLYMDAYYIHFPKNEAMHWGHAYKKLHSQLETTQLRQKNIIMSSPESSPYIYLLFYVAYDPAHYQKEAIRYPVTRDGFVDVASYGRFSFRTIDWHQDMRLSNTLIITNPNDVPDEYKPYILQSIIMPNGQKQFSIVSSLQ